MKISVLSMLSLFVLLSSACNNAQDVNRSGDDLTGEKLVFSQAMSYADGKLSIEDLKASYEQLTKEQKSELVKLKDDGKKNFTYFVVNKNLSQLSVDIITDLAASVEGAERASVFTHGEETLVDFLNNNKELAAELAKQLIASYKSYNKDKKDEDIKEKSSEENTDDDNIAVLEESSTEDPVTEESTVDNDNDDETSATEEESSFEDYSTTEESTAAADNSIADPEKLFSSLFELSSKEGLEFLLTFKAGLEKDYANNPVELFAIKNNDGKYSVRTSSDGKTLITMVYDVLSEIIRTPNYISPFFGEKYFDGYKPGELPPLVEKSKSVLSDFTKLAMSVRANKFVRAASDILPERGNVRSEIEKIINQANNDNDQDTIKQKLTASLAELIEGLRNQSK